MATFIYRTKKLFIRKFNGRFTKLAAFHTQVTYYCNKYPKKCRTKLEEICICVVYETTVRSGFSLPKLRFSRSEHNRSRVGTQKPKWVFWLWVSVAGHLLWFIYIMFFTSKLPYFLGKNLDFCQPWIGEL